jgi:hypothetical protein
MRQLRLTTNEAGNPMRKVVPRAPGSVGRYNHRIACRNLGGLLPDELR